MRPAVVEDGAALHRPGVAAGHRLGQAVRADLLAAGDRDEIFLLLRFGAEFEQRMAEQRVIDADNGAVAGVGSGDLDHGQRVSERIHARAAVFLRHFDAHQAHRPIFLMVSSGNSPLSSYSAAIGAISFWAKSRTIAAQRLVFFGQLGNNRLIAQHGKTPEHY